MAKMDILEKTTPAIALFNAICKHVARDDLREVLDLPEGSIADVVLTVNGVVIPFEDTVNDLWKQVNDDLNKRALDLVKKTILGANLEELFDRIRQSEWEIENAFKTALENINKDQA